MVLLAACGDTGTSGNTAPATSQATSLPPLSVTSADLAGGTFPKELTCDGANHAPVISLAGVPAATRSLAIEVLDPDAPSGNFTHWLAFNDGAAAATIATFPPAGSIEGRNDAGGTGYTGPCPPKGPPHHYHVMVFALGFSLGKDGAGVTTGFSRTQLDDAIKSNRGPVLARGDLVATYARA